MRGLLNDILGDGPQKLIAVGEPAFPALEVIIRDPASQPSHVSGALYVVMKVNKDRSRFLEPAIRRLADKDKDVRFRAVRLLEHIGTARDTAPIVALLWDSDQGVANGSAQTLQAIGSRRDVVALDIWLMSDANRERKGLYPDVKECRDHLAERVDKEEKRKK